MYARVTRAQTAPENLESAVKRVREQHLPAIQQEGGKGYLVLVDRTSGKAMTVALYETESALRATLQGHEERLGSTTTPLAGPREVESYEVVEDARF